MTQAMLTRWLAAVLTLGLLTFPLRADDQPRAEKTKTSQPFVVMVGISNYADKQIKPRPHAEDDAKALFKLFTDKKYLPGIDADHSRLLLGDPSKEPGSQAATHENILKALRWIAEKAGPSDLVIFGYFGEGGPLGDSGAHRCYFASDSTFEGRSKNAVAATEIGEVLKKLKSQRFCALLDVDFKGFTTNDKKIAEPTLGSNPYKEFLGEEEGDEELAKPGRAVFLASNGLIRSLDLKDHGIFAEAVIKGIEGDADKDGEPDGVVTVDELTEYLDKKMRELIRTTGKTKEEREQYFVALGGRSNHYVLTRNPAVAEEMEEQQAKFAEMVKDSTKVPAKYAEEGKELLSRMPRLEAKRKLRKEYQALINGKIDLDKFVSERKKILDSMKLKHEDAVEFAETVMDAIKIIARGYVKKLNSREMVRWAIQGLYRQVDEKLPAKIEAKLKDVADMKDDELTELLAVAREELGKREDLDKHKDIDYTLKRMLYKHTDPYTTYIDPEEKERMNKDIRGRFPGVGIQIRKDSATDQLLVVTPIKGSPAYKKGIKAGDLIIKVIREVDSHGKPLNPAEEIPTKGLTLQQAVEKITGEPGTEVQLVVQREGEKEPLTFKLKRDFVEVESVLGYKRKSDDTWDYWIDPDRKIGYIRLTQFARNSYIDMRRVMRDMVDAGVKGFILDLRFNPGGLLDVAVDISDLFVDDGVIVSIKKRDGKYDDIMGKSRGSLLDFPMVCLVNGYSASGSEIVSACLQDYKRAYIVGERSYGKGSVQHILEFRDTGGDIKLTTATFWRPSKKNLNKSSTSGKEDEDWGVRPEAFGKVVKLSVKERLDLDEHLHATEVIQRKDKPATVKKFEDKQLDEALKYLRDQINKTASRDGGKKAG